MNKEIDNEENITVEGENEVVTDETDENSTNTYAEAINDLRAEYQAKFDKQESEYKLRLAERDKVIKQLLTGDGKTATEPEDKIVELINKKRIYKKW